MNYEKKEIGVFLEFKPTGDIDKDMRFIESQYVDAVGKIPEFYNPKIF